MEYILFMFANLCATAMVCKWYEKRFLTDLKKQFDEAVEKICNG